MTTQAEQRELTGFRAAVKHVQDWIHSGDRETDKALQTGQWGRNCFEWITEYCDGLRAENKRLKTALRACAARAGNPDAAEGCRLVIATVDEALCDHRESRVTDVKSKG